MKTYIETSIAACVARGSDHHWDVLVRQATLTGMLNLFVCFAMVVLLGVLTRFVRTKTTSQKTPKCISHQSGTKTGLQWHGYL